MPGNSVYLSMHGVTNKIFKIDKAVSTAMARDVFFAVETPKADVTAQETAWLVVKLVRDLQDLVALMAVTTVRMPVEKRPVMWTALHMAETLHRDMGISDEKLAVILSEPLVYGDDLNSLL